MKSTYYFDIRYTDGTVKQVSVKSDGYKFAWINVAAANADDRLEEIKFVALQVTYEHTI